MPYPNPVRNGLIGAMLGLLLGVGLAFLLDYVDDDIDDRADLERALEGAVPVVGEIPSVAKWKKREGAFLVSAARRLGLDRLRWGGDRTEGTR